MGLRGSDNPVNDLMGLNRGKPDPRSMKKIISGQRTGDVIRPATFGDQQRYRQSQNPLNKPSLVGLQQSVYRNPGASKTAKTLKEGVKSHAEFYFGSTPEEFAYGEAIGVAATVVGGIAWKGAKGLWNVGKSLRNSIREVDRMVPGNRPPRPKQPSQPNTGNTESRRNLLKTAVIVGTGAGTIGVKNADEVIDLAQSALAKIGRKGKSLFPTGTLGRSLSDLDYLARFNKQVWKSTDEALDDFSGVTTLRLQHPDMDFYPNSSGSGNLYGGGGHSNLADTIEHINGAIEEGTAKFKDLKWMAESYFPTAEGTRPLRDLFNSGKSEKEILKKIKQMSDDIKIQRQTETEFWGGKNGGPFDIATERFLDDQQLDIATDTLKNAPERLSKILGDTPKKQHDALMHNNVIRETVRKNLNKNNKKSDPIDVLSIAHRTGKEADLPGPGQGIDMPTDIITEQQMKKIIKDKARVIRRESLQKAQKELKRKTDLSPAGRQELDKKLVDEYNLDMDYIDTVKKQRGRYAQNRTPFV